MDDATALPRHYLQASIALAVFAVLFLWGFWSKGTAALGINYFAFLLAYTLLLVKALKDQRRWSTKSLVWLVPILLIALSYLLYENVFVQWVNFLVLPVAVVAMCLNWQQGARLTGYSYFEVGARAFRRPGV